MTDGVFVRGLTPPPPIFPERPSPAHDGARARRRAQRTTRVARLRLAGREPVIPLGTAFRRRSGPAGRAPPLFETSPASAGGAPRRRPAPRSPTPFQPPSPRRVPPRPSASPRAPVGRRAARGPSDGPLRRCRAFAPCCSREISISLRSATTGRRVRRETAASRAGSESGSRAFPRAGRSAAAAMPRWTGRSSPRSRSLAFVHVSGGVKGTNRCPNEASAEGFARRAPPGGRTAGGGRGRGGGRDPARCVAGAPVRPRSSPRPSRATSPPLRAAGGERRRKVQGQIAGRPATAHRRETRPRSKRAAPSRRGCGPSVSLSAATLARAAEAETTKRSAQPLPYPGRRRSGGARAGHFRTRTDASIARATSPEGGDGESKPHLESGQKRHPERRHRERQGDQEGLAGLSALARRVADAGGSDRAPMATPGGS